VSQTILHSSQSEKSRLTYLEAGLVVLITLLIGVYFILRYSGLWMESDTANLTTAIRGVLQSGRIVPAGDTAYSNGYAYQVIVTLLSRVTGYEPGLLQQWVLPMAIILLAIPACLLFFEVTGSRRGALIGAILLFTQPEFLFVVLRGSHEKFGRLFMILALFFLFRSFKTRDKLGQFIVYAGLFYLMIYNMLASNFLVSFSFVAALFFGLLIGMLLERLRFRSSDLVGTTSQRLSLITPVCFILAFLLMFYFYPPIQTSLKTIDSMFGKTQALLLGSETATNVYEGVLNAWVNPAVYILVNLPNWLILIGSLILWGWEGWHWVIRGKAPKSRASWLLWLLYGSFGLQAALSIVSDASGVFGNLQYRLFPSFALLGVAIITDTMGEKIVHLPRRVSLQVGLGAIVFGMAFCSLIKATNEPALVNTWPFYRPPELSSLQWFDEHEQEANLWAGFGGRLPETFIFFQKTPSTNFVYRTSFSNMTYLLISDFTRLQSARTKIPLPNTTGFLTIYDNGMTQIYLRRAITPYQR
jgi:hypothetical protein